MPIFSLGHSRAVSYPFLNVIEAQHERGSHMYHVSRNGRQYGPYTVEAVRAHLGDGSLLPSDMACEEGGTLWRPLAELFPSAPTPPVTPSTSIDKAAETCIHDIMLGLKPR
jgi:hypothetical protein